MIFSEIELLRIFYVEVFFEISTDGRLFANQAKFGVIFLENKFKKINLTRRNPGPESSIQATDCRGKT